MKKEDNKFKFKWRWSALFVLIASLVMFGNYSYYQAETTRVIEEKRKELTTIGELKTKQIARWREERLLDVIPISQSPVFREALFLWLNNRNNLAQEKKIRSRMALFTEIERYNDAFLADPSGKILMSASGREGVLGPETMECINKVIKDKTARLSSLHVSAYDGTPVIDSIAPIFNEQGELKVLLLIRSSPYSYLYPLLDTWPIPSGSSESILIRKHGEQVIFISPPRHKKDSLFTFVGVDRIDLPAVKAATGTTGIYEGPDYRGLPVIAYLSHVPNSSWYLACKVDSEEVYKETKSKRIVVVLFSSTVAFLLLMTLAFIYRSQQAKALMDAEQAIQVSELRYRRLFECARDGILILDSDTGMILDANPYLEEILGYSYEEFLDRYIWEVSPFKDTALNKSAFEALKERGYTRYDDLPIETKRGEKKEVEFVSNSYPVNGQMYIQCNIRDNTDRALLQKRQDFIIDTLKLLNRPFAGKKTIEDLLILIQQYTKIEAIAIRLQEGEDYPYFVYMGFDKKFIQLENSLCVRDDNRCVVRDPSGKPLLECMCGCVIRGTTDPVYPFFTERGSFWTNSISDLINGGINGLETTSRRTCNTEGYESLAIIPLSTGPEIIGSLQLNDKKRNRFNISLITFMEELALIIGVAVRRTWQEDRIKILEVAKTKDLLQSSRLLNSGIAHELRTPMQALLNCLELIREEVGATCPDFGCNRLEDCPMKKPTCESKATIIELVDDGLERTEYSVKVLNSLSEYSKIASADEVHLINVVPELRTIMRTLLFTDQFKCLGDEDFTLTNKVDDKIGCFVSINRVDFSQLVTNLCRNSREAVVHDTPKIDITVESEGTNIKITVTDNGKGIDPELGDKIFEPYFSTKEIPEGYNQGLGLAMVRDIVAAYSGSISYTSQPGHTEFIITLPCERMD
jgi:PAS domain S-box-containing protein